MVSENPTRINYVSHCQDGSAAHRPPEGRAGHRAGGEETNSGGQFHVPRRGSVRRREDGANAWRAVGRVMADRRFSKRLKGKVMSTCVTSPCLYGTETLAMTELQQQRLQVCENNWVQKIARVARADKRRMVELREETGVQRSLTERLVRSRLQWAGHVERMADDRLPKRAAELREQGRSRRGRPRLRWGDCVKRDVKKAGEEEDWKKKTREKEGGKDYRMRRWRSCGQHLTRDKGKKRKRERDCEHLCPMKSGTCFYFSNNPSCF